MYKRQLAGCGAAPDKTSPAPSPAAPAPAATGDPAPAKPEHVNLKLFTGKIETIDVMNDIINDFNASQDRITVEQEYQKDASNIIKIKFASGQVPDIMTLSLIHICLGNYF